MAQTGYTPISIYYSSTASATPTAGNLVAGELAINTADGKLFYKDSAGVVQTIASKGTGTIGGSNTQVQYNNAGAFAGSSSFVFDGTSSLSLGTGISGAASPSLRLGNSGSGGGVVTGTLSLGSYSTGYGSNIVSSSDFSSSSASYLAFGTTSTGASGLSAPVERMRIDSSGNVLVGVTSASYSSANRGVINIGGSSGGLLSLISGSNKSYFLQSGADTLVENDTTTGSIIFGTNASTERMRIDSSGNLLVGTTGAIAAGVVGNFVNSNNSYRNFVVSNTYAGNAGTINSLLTSSANNTSSYHFIGNTGGADKVYIYGNGNIVNTNNSYGALSDEAIKENVVDVTPKLNDLLQVKVRNYNLIDDESKTKQIGVVAQELETVFPAMIEVDGMSGLKQVKYSVFVPMLIKAIQEQQVMIEELKAKVAALEAA